MSNNSERSTSVSFSWILLFALVVAAITSCSSSVSLSPRALAFRGLWLLSRLEFFLSCYRLSQDCLQFLYPIARFFLCFRLCRFSGVAKSFLRDAWWPQNLQDNAWLNPNYPRDARPDITTWWVIFYFISVWRVIYKTYQTDFRDKWTLFDLEGYQSFKVNRVLIKINKPWQLWHYFLVLFRPLLTFSWPLMSLIFVVQTIVTPWALVNVVNIFSRTMTFSVIFVDRLVVKSSEKFSLALTRRLGWTRLGHMITICMPLMSQIGSAFLQHTAMQDLVSVLRV